MPLPGLPTSLPVPASRCCARAILPPTTPITVGHSAGAHPPIPAVYVVSAEPTASASVCTAHPPGASSASAHATASAPASHATAPAACATSTAASSPVATTTAIPSAASSATPHGEGDAEIGATEWHMKLGQKWHDGKGQHWDYQPSDDRSHAFLLPIRIVKSFQATLLHQELLTADPLPATTLVGPMSFKRVRREAVI